MATAVIGTWEAVLQAVQNSIPGPSFQSWFSQAEPIQIEPDRLRIGVPNLYFKQWLEKKYAGIVADAAEKVTGERPKVEFAVSPKAFKAFRLKQAAEVSGDAVAEARGDTDEEGHGDPATRRLGANPIPVSLTPRVPASAPSPVPASPRPRVSSSSSSGSPQAAPAMGRLNPDFSLNRFVVGPCNRLAHAAAQSVLDSPGDKYNPFYIHAGPGLGKSHLLQALAAALRTRNPGMQVIYCSCEAFTNEYVRAAQENKLARFRSLFRNADALLVDDLQFLSGKGKTQEEFLHAFDALITAGKQVVVSADVHPRALAGLPAKLINRLGAGLVAGIEAPCLESRVQILRGIAARRGVTPSAEVIDLIARRISSNVRELEGAMVKYHAVALSEGRLPDLPGTRRVLRELCGGGGNAGPLTLDGIISAVADDTGLRPDDIRGASRARSILEARQVAMYLSRELLRSSLAEIGSFFGDKSHATVLHAHGQVARRLPRDERLAGFVAKLREVLENHQED